MTLLGLLWGQMVKMNKLEEFEQCIDYRLTLQRWRVRAKDMKNALFVVEGKKFSTDFFYFSSANENFRYSLSDIFDIYILEKPIAMEFINFSKKKKKRFQNWHLRKSSLVKNNGDAIISTFPHINLILKFGITQIRW